MLRCHLAFFCLVATSAVIAAGEQAPPQTKDVNGDPLPIGAIARIGTNRWRHEDLIRFAAFLPDGKSVVSVGGDRTIRVWAFPSGELRRRMNVDAEVMPQELALLGRISGNDVQFAAALSSDGKTVATFFDSPVRVKKANDPKIHLHEVATGKALTPLKAGGLSVKMLSFSPNGEQLVSTDYDGTVRVWDVAQAKELRKFMVSGGSAKAFDTGLNLPSPDAMISAPDGNALIFLKGTNAMRLVDSRTGEDIGTSGHSLPVTSVRFSADGKQLITQAEDNSTRRWDADSGKSLGLVAQPAGKASNPILDLGNAQAVSPDGKILINSQVAGLGQREFALTDSDSKKEISKISISRAAGIYEPSLLFSQDNKLVAIVNAYPRLGAKQEASVDLYDVASGKRLHTFVDTKEAPPAKRVLSLATAPTMAFSPNNQLLVASFGENVSLWDTTTGKRIGGLTTPNGLSVRNLEVTADGRCIALDTNDGSVLLYELATAGPRNVFGKSIPPDGKNRLPAAFGGLGARVQTQPGSHIAISPDGKTIALAGEDHKVHVWDIATGRELAAFEGHGGKLNAVTFSADSKKIASASADTTALVWDTSKLDRAALAAKALQPAELEQCWKTLAEGDGTKAFAGISDLTASPKEAVAFIKDRLKPSTPPDMAKVETLIAKLDDAQFKVRDQASAELTKIGEPIVPALDKALAGNLTLESKRRLEEMRNRLTSVVLQGDRLVAYRAVEVLERIGTPEARQVLQELANGAPGTLLTTSAQAALKR